jgi:hypothetical protein
MPGLELPWTERACKAMAAWDDTDLSLRMPELELSAEQPARLTAKALTDSACRFIKDYRFQRGLVAPSLRRMHDFEADLIVCRVDEPVLERARKFEER